MEIKELPDDEYEARLRASCDTSVMDTLMALDSPTFDFLSVKTRHSIWSTIGLAYQPYDKRQRHEPHAQP